MRNFKKYIISWFTAVVCGIIITGLVTAQEQIYDQLLESANEGYNLTPVGLCEDYPEETTTIETIRKDMELLKQNGIRVLRISFGWDGIETEKDQYDWGFWDDFVKTAVDEYGITLIPYICYTPRWNSTGDSLNFWNHTPVDYDEFGDFMFDLVSRYKDRIHSWELWNEPDIKFFWSGTAGDLARLAKTGSKAVRKADPEAIVVLGGLAWDVKWLESIFWDHDISPYVDVVNIHNYFETWHRSPIEEITDYVNEVQDVIDQYGDNQALWMAEVGYSTWRMTENKISEHYYAYFDYEHTFDYQAVHIFKTLALLYSTGHLDAIAWYEIKDLPAIEDVIGDNNNRNLGVAEIDHTPKPGLYALKFFNDLLGGMYRSYTNFEVNTVAGSELVLTGFEMEDGTVIFVGWLPTCQYDKRDDNKTGRVVDSRSETFKITLPGAFSKGELFTSTGKSLGNANVKVNGLHNKNTAVTGLKVDGGSLVILSLKK